MRCLGHSYLQVVLVVNTDAFLIKGENPLGVSLNPAVVSEHAGPSGDIISKKYCRIVGISAKEPDASVAKKSTPLPASGSTTAGQRIYGF